MTLITVLLGIAGLGVVVFFHELGHFLMARLVGIEVEEFSLGWGPKLAGFRRGKTLYRLSALPIGGYCRMKGEDSYRRALEQGLDEFPRDPGSFFAASPIRRILVALGGPLMNVVFAFAVFTAVMGVGYRVDSWGKRVVLASEYDGQSYPADQAGLRSGDAIVEIDGTPVAGFSQIQEAFALSPGKALMVVVDRDGTRVPVSLVPRLDRETGSGKVGVYPWIDATIARIGTDSPASLAGLREGDSILSVDGREIRHSIDLVRYLEADKPERVTLLYLRDGAEAEATLILSYDAAGASNLGVTWRHESLVVRSDSVPGAFADGFAETVKTIVATYRGIASLFMGVDVLKAVSGPARITWMVGQVATDGFSSGLSSGLTGLFNFLAVLSVGLFAMNLLPIPLLDGGSIVLYLIEAVRRKAIRVKTVFRYQTIGVVAVAALFLLTTVGDILFFSGR